MTKAFIKGWIQNLLVGDRSSNYQKVNKNCCYCIQGAPDEDEYDDGTKFVRIFVSAYVSKNDFKNRAKPLNQTPFIYEVTDKIPATDGVSASIYDQYFATGNLLQNCINLLNTVDGREDWHNNPLLNLKPQSTANPLGSTDAGS